MQTKARGYENAKMQKARGYEKAKNAPLVRILVSTKQELGCKRASRHLLAAKQGLLDRYEGGDPSIEIWFSEYKIEESAAAGPPPMISDQHATEKV